MGDANGLTHILEKYTESDFGSEELNSVFKFFSKTFPNLKNDWLLVGSKISESQVTIHLFFKSDSAVRQFYELAHSILGGPFVSNLVTRFIESNESSALVGELGALGYKKTSEITLLLNGNQALSRLMRLRDVALKLENAIGGSTEANWNLLQKFRIAVSNGDFLNAEVALNAIESSGNLDALNICFLKYQLWFNQNEFLKIWTDDNVLEILRSSRPRVVSEFLLKSLWKVIASKLCSGDVRKIDVVDIDKMSQLLKVISTPTTPEGRICLAIVTAVSSNSENRLTLDIEIDDIEKDLLNEIIRTKSLPDHLFQLDEQIELGQNTLQIVLTRETILLESEKLRESGDARGLMRVLSFAQVECSHVEDVIKKLIQCISDEELPEYAHIFLTHLHNFPFETSKWGKRSKTDLEAVKEMAEIYKGGWLSLIKMSSRELILKENVVRNSVPAWSMTYFDEPENDQNFANWLKVVSNNSGGDFLLLLSERLQNVNGGELTRHTVGKLLAGNSEDPKNNSDRESLPGLIKQGESQTLEFKATLRSPLQGGIVNKDSVKQIEFASVKSVAAFLNSSHGGILLIGVGDSGEIVGVNKDYESSKSIEDRDGFERHFRQLLRSQIHELLPGEVSITFVEIDSKDVVRVNCQAAIEPRWLTKDSDKLLYVREGNATRELKSVELLNYHRSRWP